MQKVILPINDSTCLYFCAGKANEWKKLKEIPQRFLSNFKAFNCNYKTQQDNDADCIWFDIMKN